MRKLILLVHISLDGFVAGENGELDGFEPGEENLGFICRLTEKADAALFGRVSYQLLDKYWPNAKDRPGATPNETSYSNWYNYAQKIVVSDTMQSMQLNNTIFIAGNIAAEIDKIKIEPGKQILMFGSPSVAQNLMQANLIDEYWIFINPVIFGSGISLFTAPQNKIKLRLVETMQFANGEVGLHYMPDKNTTNGIIT